ncbi:MAG TPA: acyltransferase [Nevskiaceae bacterium]|nr:acyltransferase [Nevskiaceae bacterium]
MSGPAERWLAVDGLRGIAALGVVLFHLHPAPLFWLWSMVDLFFIISGLVITAQLLRVSRLDGATLRIFWVRRALRIFPLYYALLLFTLAVGLLLHRLGLEGPPYGEGLWKYFVFLQFSELYVPGMDAREADLLRFFIPSWSIAVEEQYYLVWPLLLIALQRRPQALVIVSLLLIAIGIGARAGAVYPYVLPARLDGLAMGSLLAVWLDQRRTAAPPHPALQRRVVQGLVLLGGLLLVLPYLWLGYVERQVLTLTDGAVVISVTGFVLIYGLLIHSVIGPPGGRLARGLARGLASAPLVWLGGLSYALYLSHTPLRGLYNGLLRSQGWPRSELGDLLYLLVCIGFAWFCQRQIERRFNALKTRFPLPATARG